MLSDLSLCVDSPALSSAVELGLAIWGNSASLSYLSDADKVLEGFFTYVIPQKCRTVGEVTCISEFHILVNKSPMRDVLTGIRASIINNVSSSAHEFGGADDYTTFA